MVVEACPGPQCPGQLQGGFVFERTPFREEDEGDGESEGDTETFRVKMKPVAQKGRSREGQDWPSGLETENRGDRGDSWGTPGLEGSLRKVARDSPIICKQRSRKASGPELVGQEPPGDSLGGSKGGPRGCPPPREVTPGRMPCAPAPQVERSRGIRNGPKRPLGSNGESTATGVGRTSGPAGEQLRGGWRWLGALERGSYGALLEGKGAGKASASSQKCLGPWVL